MTKQKILIQLDSDSQPSVFDAVVAIDAGVDRLLQYGGVRPEQVRGLVHGAMYTRGPGDLKSTAIFVGGSDVALGEQIASIARETLFDPFRVSIMLDSNGSNSTAAAAVLCATRHVAAADSTTLVLAATGPVGQRVARILADARGKVFVASRSLERSKETIARIGSQGVSTDRLVPIVSLDPTSMEQALKESQVIYGCGAAGIRLLTLDQMSKSSSLQVVVDLNAVPPSGIEGVDMMDKGTERNGLICYGAIGVGGLKMKIHKASIAALFESNHQFLDCQEMLAIGERIQRG